MSEGFCAFLEQVRGKSDGPARAQLGGRILCGLGQWPGGRQGFGRRGPTPVSPSAVETYQQILTNADALGVDPRVAAPTAGPPGAGPALGGSI